MFDHSYAFQEVTTLNPGPEDSFQRVHIYSFRAGSQRYILRAEEFRHHLYAVKFYPKNLEESANKYKKLTAACKGTVSHLIGTCLHIMVAIFEKDPLASFCFKGTAHMEKWEKQQQTQRFRLYEYAMQSRFSPIKFTHYGYPLLSAYLLLNNAHDEPDLLEKIHQELMTEFEIADKPDDEREENDS